MLARTLAIVLTLVAPLIAPSLARAGLSSRSGAAGGGLPAYVPVSSAAPAASLVIKASAGTLRHVEVLNTSASTLYLQVFNAPSLPANGAAPVHVQAVAPGGNGSIDANETFSAGIVAALSSTPASLTIDTSNDGHFEGGAN